MRETKLKIEWHEPITGEQPTPVGTPEAVGILSRIGIRQVQKRCPRCESIVYSRRNILCGICGHAERLLIRTARKRKKVEQLIETDRQRYRKWVKRSASP
jgi:hypothetical protein